MILDPDQCYRALRTHDARFDGRFFVGVGTTRIYCRPVCTARTPLARNCAFFPSAAAAEARGYRPCLRCRPELAPGYASVDANRRLAQAAASLIEDGRLEEASLADLAARLEVTDRHLRRVFRQEFGVSPVAYAQTQRLLLAKRLLTDTALPVLDVAMASGFASLRRFNDLFRSRYRMTPGELRRAAPARADAARLAFDLAYRPPYDWEAMLAFLGRRAIAGVEAIAGRRYRRTVRLERGGRAHAGWIEVAPSPRRAALRVSASASLAGAVPALLAGVKTFLDLSARPDEIAAALGPLARAHPGLRLAGALDGFEVAVRAILGQQVTVAAGTTLAGRFAAAFGEPIPTPFPGVTRLFPPAGRIAQVAPPDIAALGIIAARARAIVALARAVDSGALRLEPSAPVDETLARLEALPGVGPWTAQYIAMRALAWPDAFPHPDVAVLKAMGVKAGRAPALAESWRPWRSYAVLHLWKSLEKPEVPA
jgi:AraC family transcriptional regulator of adaptative response / DNA-3-methyladenine glycosylase II